MGVFIMTFKVGDKVRVTSSKCSGINYEPYAVVTRVAVHGAMLCRGECREHYEQDENNWHYFFMNGDFELIGKTLQELNVQVGDVVQAADDSFECYGDFTCTGISESDNYRGYRYMNSDVYPRGLFGPENGLWHIVSRASVAEPTPPRKMHPDDFVNAVNDFALDNGFGVTRIEFGSTAIDGGLVRHSYSA